MAKGTSSGLLDERGAQSVFKHGILRRYVVPFAEMTGSQARDGRVVVLDGFAGRGRYPDGTPGSAELFLRAAVRVSKAVMEPVLVEKKPADYRRLAEVVAEYQSRGVHCEALPGEVARHLPTVLTQASGVPLFLFLDPCGANLPYENLAAVLRGSRRPAWPPTEVLLNFSADLTRRAAGVLKAGLEDHDALPVMDQVCGGPWWRQTALDAHVASAALDFEAAAFAVVGEYARRLASETGMHPVTVPVRRRVRNQPVYHLVFLTRSPYGIWVFADAVAHARQEWMQALGPAEDDEDGALFSFADTVDTQIEAEQRIACETVQSNLRALVTSRRSSVTLVEHSWEVFGTCYGVATEATVRKALRGLQERGEIGLLHQAKQLRNWVVGRPEMVRP